MIKPIHLFCFDALLVQHFRHQRKVDTALSMEARSLFNTLYPQSFHAHPGKHIPAYAEMSGKQVISPQEGSQFMLAM